MHLARPLAVAGLLLATALIAQSPASNPGAEAQGNYQRLKVNILKAADKMPAGDYQFKPTPDIRTYARVVNHITEAQLRACTALNGSAFDAAKVPSDTADKAAVIDGLKASSTSAIKPTEPFWTRSCFPSSTRNARLGIAWGNVSHDNEQYATLSLYLRLKGLVPPTSEK